MEATEKQMTEQESLDLIARMIHKAKDACHDTGVAAILWGAVIAVCSLVRLSELQFGYKLPFDIYWLTFVALIPQVYFSIREKKQKKVKAYGDEFYDYLWTAFGICIFLMIFVTSHMFNGWEHTAQEYIQLTGRRPGFRMYEYSSSLFLLLYGMPTFVSGMSMKFRPMIAGGIICWICCLAALYTPGKIDLLLVALSAVVAWLIPGIIMEKDYRKAKMTLAATDV